MKFSIIIFLTLFIGVASPLKGQDSLPCGGIIDEEIYLSKVDSIINALLHPSRQNAREQVSLNQLTFDDFEPLTEGADCNEVITFLDPFWDWDGEAKPIYYTAGNHYFIFLVSPRARVESINGKITISGQISGYTTVIVLKEDFTPLTLFIL